MRYRALGKTGLTVSEIGLGAWFIGGMYGDVPLDDARAIIKRALDLGVNTFDTADVYGNGLSERVLGEELRGYDVNVFTKVSYNIHQHEGVRLMTPFPSQWDGVFTAGVLGVAPSLGVNGFVLGVVETVGYRPTGSSNVGNPLSGAPPQALKP
ncbi:aldo/keto reductase [Caldivirga sp. MU80]|uniref:aldo/keto reductase n=1 Tax=Caldivirga sp. MU80 TaxID=1650354 RepID=UPI000836A1D6|nr:aldo/keto reductase [Caldivirga sp. MU80]